MSAALKITDTAALIGQRGLTPGGRAVTAVNQAALALCAPYVPVDTGRLLASGRADGTGLSYDTPYARRQYYENKGGSGLRGRLWFERMKADHMDRLVQTASAAVGGKGT